MTSFPIEDARPSIQYVQTEPGTISTFDFPFPVLSASDLRVAIDDTILTAADFSATSIGNAQGGTVTLEAPPQIGARVSIWRDMPFDRTDDLLPGSNLRASVLNAEFDRAFLLLQQVADRARHTIRRSPSDAEGDMVLPTAPSRAGRYLSFDADGRPECTAPRFLGDIQNLGLVYLGAHSQMDIPNARRDGTALQTGDLYYDLTQDVMMIRDHDGWSTAVVPNDAFLPRDGSLPMTGDLDLGGNAIVDAGLVNGRDLASDGALLDFLQKVVDDGEHAFRNIVIRNSWEIARLSGLSTHAMVNTYIDTFIDQTGIVSGRAQIPYDTGAVISGTDGSMVTIAGTADPEYVFSGARTILGAQAASNPTVLFVGKDWGDGNARTVTHVKVWGEPESWGFAEQAETCALYFQASHSGDWSGEEITLWSDASFSDPGGAHIAFDISDTTTAYRFHRFMVQETEAANDLHIMELELYEGVDGVDTSHGQIYTPETASFSTEAASTDHPSVEADWGTSGVFSHAGNTISASIGPGAIRSILALEGDFEVAFSIATVAADQVWLLGLLPSSELSQFDPTKFLGGLPYDWNEEVGDGVSIGVSLIASSSGINCLEVQGGIVTSISQTTPGAEAGDRFSLRRTSDSIHAYRNGTRIESFSIPLGSDVYLVLGSHTVAGAYDDVAWQIYSHASMTLTSQPIAAIAAPTDIRLLVDAEGGFIGENLLTESGNLTAPVWNFSGATIQPATIPAIEGEVNAFRIEETDSFGVHAIVRTLPIEPGLHYAASIRAQAGERTKLRVLWGNHNTTRFGYAVFDLAAGTVGSVVTVGTSTPFTASISEAENGWYRCTISGRIDDETTFGQFNLSIITAGTLSAYQGNLGAGLSVCAPQLEASDQPGPYHRTGTDDTGIRPVWKRDVTATISRNGGDSFSPVIFDEAPARAYDRTILNGYADVSNQTDGAQIVVRLTTRAPGPFRIHRWAVQSNAPLDAAT